MNAVGAQQPKQAYLEESQLFAGLSAAQLKRVDEITATSRCERGRIFFAPGDAPGTIYFLKEGRVRLYRRTEGGKQLTVAVLDRGAVFGESALIGQANAGVYAEADEECMLCVCPAEHLRTLVTEIPTIGLNLLEYVGGRLQRSQEQSEEIAYWSVRRRLARTLLELDERYGRPTLDGTSIIDRTFTQAELAEMIGSTRETVAELMSQLKGTGVLGTRRRRVIVQDAQALRAMRDVDAR